MIQKFTLQKSVLRGIIATVVLTFGSATVLANPDSCQLITNIQANAQTVNQDNYHAIALTWDAVAGATGYEVQYSFNGTTYINTVEVTENSYLFEAGYNPNTPYWFRIRMKTSDNSCDWTNEGPRYTAANLPANIILTATNTSISLNIPTESPISNPSYTTYSVFCTTNSLYVQPDGSFGETESFLTRAEWSEVSITDITENETYCFYTRVQNNDGAIRYQSGESIMATQEFNSNILVSGTSQPTNVWFAPNSNQPISWTANGPCNGGAIGFNGNWNNFWGNFIRLPKQDASGLDAITLAFTLSNSYASNTPNSYFRFYIWADNGYRQVVSGVTINGTQISTNNYGTFYFNEPRECAAVEVTFNLESISNKSDILIYLEANSYYNNSSPFWFYFDDITVKESTVPAVCVTTTLSVGSFESTTGIYPIPADRELNIRADETVKNITIFSLSGQQIISIENTNNIEVSALAKGVYIAQITLENGIVTNEKFVKN